VLSLWTVAVAQTGGVVRVGRDDPGIAQNFLACDREQELLLPPSLREWLPEGHLAWFVIDAVAELDLSAFYAAYREDGHGRAAHDPAMMVALLLYAYATGRRSSRVIERACIEDVAVRVVAANQRRDHCTIARLRQRHEAALAGLLRRVRVQLHAIHRQHCHAHQTGVGAERQHIAEQVASRAAAGGKAPLGGGPRGALPGERGLRGLSRARGDEGRPALRQARGVRLSV